eukprot:m.537417 g.537417  ORF g.537417 m.537417 type:complete len:301 (+) comp22077_c0_seq6:90-992(+)
MRMCACSYVMYCALVAPMNNTAQGFGAFSGVSLQLSMSNNGITTVDPGFLSGIPCPVTVDLSQNNITQISTQSFQFMGSVNLSHNAITSLLAHAFHGSNLSSLDLSHNNITAVSDSAFDYTFYLQALNVTHNFIRVIPVGLLSNTPALNKFIVSHNYIRGLPVASNHLASVGDGTNNTLQCDAYGPELVRCHCASEDSARPLVFSTHCGYGRCLETTTGCSEDTFLDVVNCTLAPYSVCKPKSICEKDGQFTAQSATITSNAVCLNFTDCAAAFGMAMLCIRVFVVSNLVLLCLCRSRQR